MRTEKILAAIFAIGLIYRYLHWKGATYMMLISMLLLSLMYFGFAFYFFSDRTISRQNLPFSIIGGVLLSVLPMAILFKLLYWNGADVMALTSVMSGFLVLAISFIIKGKNSELRTYYNNMMKRSALLTLICLVLILTPMATIIKLQHYNNPELANLKIQAFQHPENKAAQDSLDNYFKSNPIP